MSSDKDIIEEEAASSMQDNASSNDDESSVFSDLEPPPPPQPSVIPNPPETNDSSLEEEKEEIVENDKEESKMMNEQSKNIAKLEEDEEEDVEEGKIVPPESNKNVVSKEKEETSKQVEMASSPLVHIGSTRGGGGEASKPTAAAAASGGTRNNRTLMIAGLCLCLFVIVIVQAITLGLVLNQKSNNDKGTSSSSDSTNRDPPRIPTVRPTTRVPTHAPTPANAFASIANEPGVIRLNQVSFCDECTEYVRVSPWEDYLPWNAWTYVTEIEVNSNGFVSLYCWNFGNCGMIDIVALNLSPNVKGSVYLLWEQNVDSSSTSSLQKTKGVNSRQSIPQRSSTLTISFEEVMVFGFYNDNAPYQVNAQVKISQGGEISICYGAGNIENNSMRSGLYNYTANYNYLPATGFPFDRNGYASTFPAGTCQSFSSSWNNGGFVPTESPTYFWYTSSPDSGWYYPTPTPSDWYYYDYPTRSPSSYYYYPTPRPQPSYYYYPTPRPSDWNYYPTSRPSDYYYYYPTPRPTRYYYTSSPTTPTGYYYTSSPTYSPTFAYFTGFEYIADNPDARPLEIVSNCNINALCEERTRFESFPYKFRGRDNIWEIAVSSNGYLELIGDCIPRGSATCAVINVATTDLVPGASTIGDRIWYMETSESYIYSFEYVPIRGSSSASQLDVEEDDDPTWMMDDDWVLDRHLQQEFFPQGNVSAQVHLFFDGQIDICWGEIFLSEFNQTFTSSIYDFVEDTTIPANGYYFDEEGSLLPYRNPFYTCQTLLSSDMGPSPQPTVAPSFSSSGIGSSDKLLILNRYYGEVVGDAGEWILILDDWSLPAGADPEMYVERYILAKLFFSTSSLGWSNQVGWLSSSRSVCEWAGIVCNRNLRVKEINLVSNGLSGVLPWQLGRLDFLELLSFDHNELQSGFNQLSTMSLVHVSMRNVTLTGTIPSSIGSSLPRLTFLDLAQNYLRGTIPSEILLLSDLKHLNLGNATLTGTIPASISRLTSLTFLDLAQNYLRGTIPSEILMLTNLKHLNLGNLTLIGTIPSSISWLTRLTFLDLAQNYLKGTIPSEILMLSDLKHLNLADNQLSGTIPFELWSMYQLEELHLDRNSLTGTIPTTLIDLSNLSVFSAGNNMLTGNLPPDRMFVEMTSLRQLHLGYNRLTGTIAPLIARSQLEELELQNNLLIGGVPDLPPSLKLCNLSFNNLEVYGDTGVCEV